MTSLPREGNEGIDEEQVFLLALDAPADPASFKDAWCEASGINERIPLDAASGEGDARAPRRQPLRRVQPLSRVLQGPAAWCRSRASRSRTSACRAAGRGGALRAAAARRAPRSGSCSGRRSTSKTGLAARDAAAACLRGAAGFRREAHLPAREQGRRVPAGDADRPRLQRARAARGGRRACA